jgi:hypothetical protein
MPETDDPVIHLLTGPVPAIETQPVGQVVYADETKKPGRAIPTVEVPATLLAECLKEATREIAESAPDASPTAEKKALRKVRALSKRDHSIHEIVGAVNFNSLTNSDIMRDAKIGRQLRKDHSLKIGKDATKSCLDRIRRAMGYPLSRNITNKRSTPH